MDEKTRKELALFRFSPISPLVGGSTDRSMKKYLEEACAKGMSNVSFEADAAYI